MTDTQIPEPKPISFRTDDEWMNGEVKDKLEEGWTKEDPDEPVGDWTEEEKRVAKGAVVVGCVATPLWFDYLLSFEDRHYLQHSCDDQGCPENMLPRLLSTDAVVNMRTHPCWSGDRKEPNPSIEDWMHYCDMRIAKATTEEGKQNWFSVLEQVRLEAAKV